ncbi:SDR family oxidoreductase [Alkalihalophilus marmarensis]|uniref:SDR family oxidoreductase n=1 Tax=Alkalihalophilus marmarensis TaxID=521377 RepID=UPI002E20B13C|nr:SDR family oxidoreductase [Alkalihalophilus marmarensis]
MALQLAGKTAVVTGAGSGMGKAVAQLFVSEGANVVFADINMQAAEDAASVFLSDTTIAVKADVANAKSVQSLISETVEKFGTLHIIVNCAGIPQSFTQIEELEEAEWDRLMDLNTKSIFLTTKYAVPYFKKQHSGSIINVCSIAGVRARPGLNAYCASKGGAIMLTKALAIELAPYKIRVNAINPGPTETPMISQFLADESKNEDINDIFVKSMPLGALIQSEEIAQAALYLSTDAARSVTGEILNVDGGRGI